MSFHIPHLMKPSKPLTNTLPLTQIQKGTNQAYQYLVQVYMVTKNYDDAIQSIENIQVKNSSINKAYQRVTFYRGLELFNNLAYNAAITSFDKSLANSYADRELKARAIYWKAESLYRLGDLQCCHQCLQPISFDTRGFLS